MSLHELKRTYYETTCAITQDEMYHLHAGAVLGFFEVSGNPLLTWLSLRK